MMRPKLGLAAWSRSIKSKLGPDCCVLILMYHRIAELKRDPWSLCVSPFWFEEHLCALKDWGARIVSLAEIAATANERRPQRLVAITFDDGYADNYHAAYPLLSRHAAPATFFVTSGPVVESREFWWDALEQLLQPNRVLPEEVCLSTGSARHRWRTSDPLALYRAVWEVLGDLVPGQQNEALSSIAEQLGQEIVVRETHRPFHVSELAALASCGRGLIEIGGHTRDHPRLNKLSYEEQRRQMVDGKQALERIIGERVRSFAYPFGAYTKPTVQAAREVGFDLACTTAGCKVDRYCDRFRLPRLPVPNVCGEDLIRELSAVCP